jgi:hypothetical protein
MWKCVIACGIALPLLNLFGAPPPIIWQSDEKRPEVIDGRENIIVSKDASENASAGFDPETSAGRIVQKGYHLTWSPKWNYYGTGGVKLPGAAVSKDRSVLAVLETVGEERGPWQSRIVCISPVNGHILRIIELKERKIERILFSGEKDEVLLYQSGQQAFDQKNRFVKVNLRSGKIVAEYPPLPGDEIQAFNINANGSHAVVKMKKSSSVLVYDLEQPEQEPLVLDSGFEGGAVGFAADGESVLAAGEGAVRFLSMLNPGTQTRDPIVSPDGFVPDFLEVAADGAHEIIVGKVEGGPFYLLRGGRNFLLDDSGEGFACFTEKSIMLVAQSQSTVRFLDRGTLAETARVPVKNDRPPTRGNLAGLFYDPDFGLLAVDSHGNIYTRKLTGRKWNKKLLLSAKK